MVSLSKNGDKGENLLFFIEKNEVDDFNIKAFQVSDRGHLGCQIMSKRSKNKILSFAVLWKFCHGWLLRWSLTSRI